MRFPDLLLGGGERLRALVRRLAGPLRRRPPKPGLGAFLGVYTPTILTILGVILYLRFGWVVGHAGFFGALVIVLLANAITLVTALAVSAGATNARVGVGGAYYIISRSLGPEIGGAIGVPLFLSQALSVTLYAFGLAESLRIVWPDVPLQFVVFLIIAAVGALSSRGADSALRSQVPILLLIAVSLAALTLGAFENASSTRLLGSRASGEVGFWAVFAVFFPAVTGVMAGLGLSGDLRDPKRAIPRGTLAASLTGLVVYLCVPFLLAMSSEPAALREDPLVWTRIAPLGAWLILPGLWGAVFSSAVGSMLGAPRTLQALARDGVAPRFFDRRSDAGSEPVGGLWIALGLALACVFLGDLNAVATVVTMIFLTVYGVVNLAAALEDLSGDPSWRPELRVHWSLYLMGAMACFGVMLLINLPATLIAIGLELGIWLFLQRRKREADWGDVRRGVYEALIRSSLIRLAARPTTARSWRPHILVFPRPIESHLELVRAGGWFSQNRGIVTVCELIEGDLLDLDVDLMQRQEAIRSVLAREGLAVFGEVNVVRDIDEGIVSVAQANGMAGIQSNVVLLGWPDDAERLSGLLRVIRRLESLHKSLLIGHLEPIAEVSATPTVDVWWGGLQRNGDLMLLLAHLLTLNRDWQDARVRILSVASNEHMKALTERMLSELMPAIRIRAEVEVVLKPADDSVLDVIHRSSAETDLVLLGLATPDEGEEEDYAERLIELAAGFRSFLFVKNASLFIGDLVSADEELDAGRVPLPKD